MGTRIDSNSSASRSDTDRALLQKIAQARSEAAFVTLYDRYQRSTYNLCMNILRNRELALEAMQESMQKVWLRASDFRDGNAKIWIHRIAAYTSIGLHRKERAYRKRVVEQTEHSVEPFDRKKSHSPAADVQARERDRMLQSELAKVDQADRRMLVLYYGGGLTQEEIAKQFSMPTRTVSSRLERVLKKLRARLSAAGCALAGSGWLEELIRNSMLEGYEVPADLADSVRSFVFENSDVSQVQPGHRHKPVVMLLCYAAVLIVGAAAWMATRNTSPEPSPDGTAAAPVRNSTATFPMRWTFEKGLPPEFKIKNGHWAHRPAEGGRPAVMDALVNRKLGIFLETEVPRQPFVLTFKAQRTSTPGSKIWFGAFWSEKDKLLARESTHYRIVQPSDGFEVKIYFIDRLCIELMNQQVLCIRKARKSYPADHILFWLRNTLVSEMSLDLLKADEVRKVLEDTQPEKKRASSRTIILEAELFPEAD